MSSRAKNTAQPRPVGRPRLDARTATDPVSDIMAVAGHLFATGGYDAITMARIARGVGLRQQSLYYYFANKDDLVAAFVARAYAGPITIAEQIRAEAVPRRRSCIDSSRRT